MNNNMFFIYFVLYTRMKSVLKSLTSIGGHLSQSKEYRDIYDDILNIVSFCYGFPLYYGWCISCIYVVFLYG
jgi:hypothetical protein